MISETQRFQLWDLEGSGATSSESLVQILKDFPVQIDYVVLLGDDFPGDKAAKIKNMIAELGFENAAGRNGSLAILRAGLPANP